MNQQDSTSHLFQTNLKMLVGYLTQTQIDVLASYKPTVFELGFDQGVPFVHRGGIPLTSQPEEPWAIDRMRNFFETPIRLQYPAKAFENFLQIKDLPEGNFGEAASKQILRKYRNLLKNSPASDQMSIACICLGVGLGFHLLEFYQNCQAQHLIVADFTLDCMYHALHVIDWMPIVEAVEARNGEISFLFDFELDGMVTLITQKLKSYASPLNEGSYLYCHYQTEKMIQLVGLLRYRYTLVNAHNGWMEDEFRHLTNSIVNIRNTPHILSTYKAELPYTPAFVIGSGPSLDLQLEALKRIQNYVVIFSCGSSLEPLLAAGIKPDFHCELENGPHLPVIAEEIGSRYDLRQVTLIASTTVDPMLAANFGHCMYFFREGNGFVDWLAGSHESFDASAPSCVNAGARAALALGFKQVVLSGVDLGKAVDQDFDHHAKNSFYQVKKNIINPELEHMIGIDDGFSIPLQGNLGGAILSTNLLLFVKDKLEELAASHAEAHFYNTSKGAQIVGFKPLGLSEMAKKLEKVSDHEIKVQLLDRLGRCCGQSFRDFKTTENLLNLSCEYTRLLLELDETIDRYCSELSSQSDPDILMLFLKDIDKIRHSSSILETQRERKSLLSALTGNIGIFLATICSLYYRAGSHDERGQFMKDSLEVFRQYLKESWQKYNTRFEALVMPTGGHFVALDESKRDWKWFLNIFSASDDWQSATSLVEVMLQSVVSRTVEEFDEDLQYICKVFQRLRKTSLLAKHFDRLSFELNIPDEYEAVIRRHFGLLILSEELDIANFNKNWIPCLNDDKQTCMFLTQLSCWQQTSDNQLNKFSKVAVENGKGLMLDSSTILDDNLQCYRDIFEQDRGTIPLYMEYCYYLYLAGEEEELEIYARKLQENSGLFPDGVILLYLLRQQGNLDFLATRFPIAWVR
ncbi:MAG: 6-hydroxymethylpterin diphosphokinase MptE-like protein, partial [Alphaproteobacteria bacterium]|nr:6-hydroxymethylpterin diphosphokinase MptE-like protein [Alphaproteobacteria bacterium]